jgi:DUF1009 family protein
MALFGRKPAEQDADERADPPNGAAGTADPAATPGTNGRAYSGAHGGAEPEPESDDVSEVPDSLPDSEGPTVKTTPWFARTRSGEAAARVPPDDATGGSDATPASPAPADAVTVDDEQPTHQTPSYLTPFPQEIDRIAMVAGGGRFPFLLAQAARGKGVNVTAFAINDITDPTLEQQVDAIEWLELGQFGKLIDRMKELGLRRMAMVGRVKHTNIFKYRHFDKRAMKVLASAATMRADSLLGALCRELAKEGLEVLDSTMFIRSLMPPPGMVTTGRELTAEEREDIAFGFPLARAVAGHDIGQSIIVKSRLVVAVEAAEGTDRCIERAGQVGGEGFALIKVSKPDQDMRFDVPVIGSDTIRRMREAGGAVIAISAGESLIFDREEVARMADEAGIAIVAIDNANPPKPSPLPTPEESAPGGPAAK